MNLSTVLSSDKDVLSKQNENILQSLRKDWCITFEKFELGFPVPKCESGWYRFENNEITVPLQKSAQRGNFALVDPKVSLCCTRRGEPMSI